MANTIIVACILAAATYYDLPPAIIQSVLDVEGGKVGECSRNTNGTKDCGPMQVNSIHLPELSKIYGLSSPEIEKHLTFDPCFNISVGAWLLKGHILSSGDFWTGVGYYHSRTEERKRNYQSKVVSKAAQRFGPSVFAQR